MKLQKPQILSSKTLAKTRLFEVEERQLRFSNGAERTYERLVNRGHGAVMMVPMLDDHRFLMIREYAGGFHDYQLSLPKGAVSAGEPILEAANRELQEEVGYAADNLQIIKEFSMSPNYISATMSIIVASSLRPSRLPGDEPEPLIVEEHSFRQLSSLVMREEFTEARAIAALYLVKDMLEQQLTL